MWRKPDGTPLESFTEVEHFHDPHSLTKTRTSRGGSDCSLPKIAVDNWLPTPWYLVLCPMDFAWATVDIIRRAAVECKEREVRRPKLYESLDFLEKPLDEKSTWLVVAITVSFAGIGATIERRKSFGRFCA
jgi:hypothetical protein